MISVVIPVYNEAENLEALYERLSRSARSIPGEDFEFVLADDGSRDATPQVLERLCAGDPRVRSVRFDTNRGSHAAISAGLAAARGEAAIVMAADLQDPPELMKDLIARWREGHPIVWGVRRSRSGEAVSTVFFSRLYYFLMNHLTAVRQPPSGADLFLASREVIECFKRYPEKQRSVFMLVTWLGFRSAAVYYDKKPRRAGKSKWTLKKKLALVWDSYRLFRKPRHKWDACA
ncbi:MAG: glycosyltransferase family 2 protein [Candidatus Omnitrophica bacterium]|nr:glycosyltransferase family 2 protein [Candidatus Omnitrophota bacterium]